MGGYINKAFWLPIRDFGAVLRIFWPLIILLLFFYAFLAFGVVALFGFELPSTPEQLRNLRVDPSQIGLLIFIIISGSIYIYIVAASGIVKWHRVIVLNEPPTAISIQPNFRSWRYFGYSLLLGLAFSILYVIVLIPSLALNVIMNFSAMGPGGIQENLSAGDLSLSKIQWLLTSQIIMLSVIITLSVFLFALLLGRSLLVLPRVAIEVKEYRSPKKVLQSALRGSGWRLAIAIVFVLPILLSILLQLIPIYLIESNTDIILAQELNRKFTEARQGPVGIGIILISNILYIYGALAFASLLSVFYRDRVRPALIQHSQQQQL